MKFLESHRYKIQSNFVISISPPNSEILYTMVYCHCIVLGKKCLPDAGSFLCGTFQNTNATFTSHASQFVFSTPYIISMSLFRTNHCQISTVLTSIAHKLNGFFISRVWSLYSKLNEKNSIGVQRFVGDAKQTLEIRVERRGNRQGENRGEKSILINERLFAFFLHLYYYFKEPSGLDHE